MANVSFINIYQMHELIFEVYCSSSAVKPKEATGLAVKANNYFKGTTFFLGMFVQVFYLHC